MRLYYLWLCLIILQQSACKLRLTGIKDEIKHVDKELKKTMPELQKVI